MDYSLLVLRQVVRFAALFLLALPDSPDARQFGGLRRVEVSSPYPYTAVGKWTYGDGGSRTICTAFLVNNCTVVTARRCGRGKAGSFQFETGDGQRFQVRNVRTDHAGENDETKPGEPDLEVTFGQIAARSGPSLGEKYGRFGLDGADTVAASSGVTPHCSFGFSHNKEGKGGRGTLDPDVCVWGSMPACFPARRAAMSSSCT